MEPGKVVYLCWYDFQREKEYVLTGEVTDNALYGGTMWEDWVYVKFTVPGMSAPICHHFLPEKLSTVNDNVPHDDCYLACAKRKDNTGQESPSFYELLVQQFKEDHWDRKHNHLKTDSLETFYFFWKKAHGEPAKPAKKPAETITQGSPAITQPSETVHVEEVAYWKAEPKPKKQEVVQLSLF